MSVNDLIEEGKLLFESGNIDGAIGKFNQAWDAIEDKNSQLKEQNDIQSGLGYCYLAKAIKAKDITEAKDLFTQATAYYQQQLELARQLGDEQVSLQEQNDAQFGLGHCYFKQAIKAKDVLDATRLFTQAIAHYQQQLELARQLKDEQVSLQEQNNAQSWISHCYFEQAMKAKDAVYATSLFAQAIAHYQQQLELARQLEGKQAGIQEQNDAQFWLGHCYFELGIKAKDITEAKDLFAQATAHYQQQLKLAGQLEDKQASIQEQSNAQFGLGHCYLGQAMKAKDVLDVTRLFTQAIAHYQQRLELLRLLEGKRVSLQEQSNAQFWVDYCYFEQARKGKDVVYAMRQAIEYYQKRLKFARQLDDPQASLREQGNAQSWLGGCYFEWAIKTKIVAEEKHLFEQAIQYFESCLECAKQLEDEQANHLNQIYAQYLVGLCYVSQGIKIKNNSQTKSQVLFKKAKNYFLGSLKLLSQFDDEQERYRIKKIICNHLRNIYFLRSRWDRYFNKKKQEIHEILFSNENNSLDEKLKETISTVLAVLHIPPIELGSTPLAHYTSSTVCNKLFGVVNEDAPSPMRIGSSTYMNDPSEGKGLLELLKLQDLELENKEDCSSHNAFFACFSARVNDLNQFRLYGKEDGVEASGCCLVFNKNRDWLKEPDISAPFRSFLKNLDENSAEFKETDISNVEYEKLPLYQVAYIAYKDEYITKEKCEIWLDNLKFGICLKPIGENNDWHNFRLNQLKEALQELVGFFKEKEHVNDKNKNALEYIRYLFKDFAFRDEEEFRVLKMAEIGSEEIEYCKTTKSIYLPYADISNVVDEVILGTNYEKTNSRRKAEVFQHQMRQKCPNVKVSRSSLPIYANPPIKKD